MEDASPTDEEVRTLLVRRQRADTYAIPVPGQHFADNEDPSPTPSVNNSRYARRRRSLLTSAAMVEIDTFEAEVKRQVIAICERSERTGMQPRDFRLYKPAPLRACPLRRHGST